MAPPSRHGVEPSRRRAGPDDARAPQRRRSAAAHKRGLRRWLRAPDGPDELVLIPGVVVRRLDDVEQARDRAERYVQLRAQWIVSDPEINGDEPVIKGSRVGVHTLAARIADGESDAVLDEDFPHIPAEAREVAALSPTLVQVANAGGFEATCNRDRGLLGATDAQHRAIVQAEGYVLVTDNAYGWSRQQGFAHRANRVLFRPALETSGP